MEKFFALSTEKQRQIINGAMAVFSSVPYKKASTADIAAAAGISKSMLFFYFGSKKALYLYLGQVVCEKMQAMLETNNAQAPDDFFERVSIATTAKLQILRQNPMLIKFMSLFYFETDPEVAAEIAQMMRAGAVLRNDFVLSQTDRDKFKDTVKPELVLALLLKYAEGYANSVSQDNLEAMTAEFYSILAMLKNNLYKGEYLS